MTDEGELASDELDREMLFGLRRGSIAFVDATILRREALVQFWSTRDGRQTGCEFWRRKRAWLRRIDGQGRLDGGGMSNLDALSQRADSVSTMRRHTQKSTTYVIVTD